MAGKSGRHARSLGRGEMLRIVDLANPSTKLELMDTKKT
jgi:hypothetical protein